MWTDVKHARTAIEKTSGRIAKKKKTERKTKQMAPKIFRGILHELHGYGLRT